MRSIPIGARPFVAALAVHGACPPITSYVSYSVMPAAPEAWKAREEVSAVNQWNANPVDVDTAGWRVQDWSHPQFLEGLR